MSYRIYLVLIYMLFCVAGVLYAQESMTSPEFQTSSLWYAFAKMMLALAFVILLIYGVLGKGLLFLSKQRGTTRRIQIVERCALDAKNSICLVKIDQREFVVAVGDARIMEAASPSTISLTDDTKKISKSEFRNLIENENTTTSEDKGIT